MGSRRIVEVVVAAGLALGVLVSPGLANAQASLPRDPNCIVNQYGSPGTLGYTAHFTYNNCRVPVRAIVLCSDMWTTGSHPRYGGTITGTGWSRATCDITQNLVGWGWQRYYDGQWATYYG